MFHTRQCPKCGSRNIAGPHKMQSEGYVRIDLPGFSTATLETFTCADCGYTEMYSDEVGLENIRRSGRFVLNREANEGRTCPYCQTPIGRDARYCPECGNSV